MISIRNFRSLGGIPSSYGIVKPRLFRGGPLDNISTEDCKAFQNTYQIKTIYDLRSDAERQRHPNKNIRGIKDIPFVLMDENAKDLQETLTHLRQHNFKAFMIPMYQSFVTSTHTLTQHKRFIQSLINNPSGTYFHCSAGKDRTGFTAALILKLLGVHDTDIMKDYLLTNKRTQEDIEILLADIHKQHGHLNLSDADLDALMYVKEIYLDAAFTRINQVYGSFDQYIQKGLQLENNLIESLRACLIE